MNEIILRGKPIGRISGILFDKDGTLVNSEEYLLRVSRFRIFKAKEQVKKEGYSNSNIDNLEKLLTKAYGLENGTINPNSLTAIASKRDNMISTATIISLITEDWSKSIKIAYDIFSMESRNTLGLEKSKEDTQLLPGLKKLLEESHKRNIKTSIISNDTKAGIKNFINDNHLEKQFISFWSAEDFPAKPNPNSVKNLCKLMELDVSNCALIGDSNSDMQMARNSGIKIALGYTGGWRRSPVLYEHHHLIHQWEDLKFIDSSKINVPIKITNFK